MKQDTSRNILEVIQHGAADGSVGSYSVRKVDMTMLMVQNNSGTMKWMLDAQTGAAFEHTSNDIVEQLRRTLVEPRHENVQIEYRAVNTVSKWVETNYLYLPLSIAGISEYRGKLTATRLDFHDESVDSPLSASEIIGLGVMPGDAPPRLWNVTGSVPNKNGGEFDRVVEMEHCKFEFSSATGEYCLTKLPSCAQFEAPLGGLERGDVPVGMLLDGMQAAPVVDAGEAFASGLTRCLYKR